MALAQHRLRVMRLYRGALKNALNWAIERELFYEYAKEIRGKFEENLRITDLREAQRVLVAGEKYLQERIHPDPWTPIWAPGGSKYQRNLPAPPELIDPKLWEAKYGNIQDDTHTHGKDGH